MVLVKVGKTTTFKVNVTTDVAPDTGLGAFDAERARGAKVRPWTRFWINAGAE